MQTEMDGQHTFMTHHLFSHILKREHILHCTKDCILIYDDRIVIPKTMRLEMLNKIHQGHLGITKCHARAREAVWWPGISLSIEEMIKNCFTCAKVRPTPTEPLIVSSYPSRPWERVGMDLFEFEGSTYLIVVCYRSRWPEVKNLQEQHWLG